ncbi:hypothetical protein ACSBR2_015025 [Camellia fascicularis]
METDVGDSSIHPEIVTKTFSEYDLFINRKRSKKMKNVRSEFDHCLEDDILPRTFGFDVLNWWKANGPKYLTLQAIARDILAIHVSIVASKSAFSTSERRGSRGMMWLGEGLASVGCGGRGMDVVEEAAIGREGMTTGSRRCNG